MNTSDLIHDLKNAMKQKQLTQQKLAFLTGISQGTVSKILHGKMSLNFSTVLTLWPFIYDAPFPHCSTKDA